MKDSRRFHFIMKKVLIYIILLIVTAVMILPFLWMLSASIKSDREVFMMNPFVWIPKQPRWSNYIDIWTKIPMLKFVTNTVILTVVVTFLQLLTSSFAAYSFAKMEFKYKCNIDYMFPDNEEVVLIRGLRKGAPVRGVNALVRGCIKEPINDRIDLFRTMLAYDMFWYIEDECKTLVDAISSALWDEDAKEDTRLDDFTSDIDTMDAFEYSWTKFMRQINDVTERKRVA